MMKNKLPIHNPARQTGTVLAVSLIILLVLTIIGISSLSTSSLEEKISGNFRDREIAFQAAEAALAYAEEFARENINSTSVFNDTNGYYSEGKGPKSINALDGGPNNASSWWTGSNSQVLPDSRKITYVKTQPRFTIEYRGDVGEEQGTDINVGAYGESSGGGVISAFRITVRATGLSDNTWVVLQSFYGKRL
jgi:type IV pilus assembly protein PilX